MDAILKGLVLAEAWGLKKMTFITDSQTVYGWLGALLNNTKRVKVSGLHEVGVKHRLQVIRDTIDPMGVQVDVKSVPTQQNRAEKLTRVPEKFLALWKALRQHVQDGEVAGAVVEPELLLVSLADLKSKQKEDPVIQQVVEALEGNGEIAARSFHKVKSQLVVHNGMLQRSVKLSPNDVWVVPVVPSAMEERVLLAAHEQTGMLPVRLPCASRMVAVTSPVCPASVRR